MVRGFIRFILLGVVVLVLLLFSVFGVYYYFVIGKQYKIQELISEVVWRETGSFAYFDDYRFGIGGDFPFVSLRLENVVLHDSAYADHGHELLRARELGVSFRPWKLVRGEIVVKSIDVHGAKIQLYRSAEGRLNRIFQKKASSGPPQEKRAPSHAIFSIDKIKVDGLEFEFLDSMRRKDFHFDLGRTVFHFTSDEKSDFVRIEGDWYFEELTFKMDAGGFLVGKTARVDLLLEFGPEAGLIHFRPSRLKIDGNDFDVAGTLRSGRPAYLKLLISSPGIKFADALGTLNEKIRKGLRNYSVSSPVQFSLLLEGPMLPGHPLPLALDFSFSGADFSFRKTRFTDTSARGRFINNCAPSGKVDPHSGCLTVSAFSGKLAGAVPVAATLEVRDLEDAFVIADAQVETTLTEVGEFLPPGRFRARSGTAVISAHYQGKPSRLDRISRGDSPDILRGKVRIVDGGLAFQSPKLQLENIDAELEFDNRGLRMEKLNLLVNGDSFQLKGKVDEMLSFIIDPADQHLKAELDVRAPRLVVDHFLAPAGSRKEKKKPRVDEGGQNTHFGKVIEGLFAKLEASLSIHSEELTYRKLRAREVLIVSHLKNDCGDFPGGCLVVDTLQAVVYGGIPLSASMVLRNPQDPILTLDARLEAHLPSIEGLAPPEKMQFRKGEAAIDLHYEGRLEDYPDIKQAARNADLSGKVWLRDVALDYVPQGYRIEDLQGALSFDERDLMVDSLDLAVNNTQLFIEGDFRDFITFLFDPGSTLAANLRIRTPNLDFANFPRRKKLARPRDYHRKIPGESAIAQTVERLLERIEGNLDIDAGELHFRGFDARDVRLYARFLDDCQGKDEGAGCVIVDTFSAVLFNDASLQASLKIEDLSDPFFAVEAVANMQLEDLNAMFPADKFIFHGGTAAVDFKYQGRPHDHFDAMHLVLNAALEGRARLQDASFDVVTKGYRFRHLDAHLDFNENDLFIRNMNLELNQNDLIVQGEIRKFVPFLFVPEQQLSVVLDIESDEINFGNFSAPRNFENIEKDSTYQPTVITKVVDNALDNMDVALRLSGKEVKYKSFFAENVEGEFRMNPDLVALNGVRMDIAQGAFHIQGKIGGLTANAPKIGVETRFEHVDVSEIFSAFDNFGQDDLTSENIHGDLSAVITFSGEADSNYDLVQETMEGKLNLKIVNGQLVDLPAMKKMKNFLLSNRNFDDVRFATLENTFTLNGGDLEMEEFRILSTVIAFLVEGRYCFNDNDHTDLLVSVPLANLWKKNLPVERLEEFRTGKRRGVRILLRARNNDGELKIKPVLTKKSFLNDLDE